MPSVKQPKSKEEFYSHVSINEYSHELKPMKIVDPKTLKKINDADFDPAFEESLWNS